MDDAKNKRVTVDPFLTRYVDSVKTVGKTYFAHPSTGPALGLFAAASGAGLGYLTGDLVTTTRTYSLTPNLMDIEAAQKAGNVKALEVANKHSGPLDAETLEKMLEARTTEIAKVTAQQSEQQNAASDQVRADVSCVGESTAAGAVAFPLVVALITALPISGIKKIFQQVELEQSKQHKDR